MFLKFNFNGVIFLCNDEVESLEKSLIFVKEKKL